MLDNQMVNGESVVPNHVKSSPKILETFPWKTSFELRRDGSWQLLVTMGWESTRFRFRSIFSWPVQKYSIFVCIYIIIIVYTSICIRNNHRKWRMNHRKLGNAARAEWIDHHIWPDPATKSSLLSLSRLIMHRMYGKSVLEGICCRCLPFHSCGMILCISGSSAWPITWFIHCASP
jgi:hypothetical protein